MNAITHPHRIDSNLELLERARRAARSALPVAIAVAIFTALFVAALVVRFLHLAQTNPGAAATLHRVAQALGFAS
jgi:hypothetical protein